MGWVQDVRIGAIKAAEHLWPFHSYRRFGDPLPSFPVPMRIPLPDPLPMITIATPCKDAEHALPTYFALINTLDYPKDRIHLRLLEGDSGDDTYAVAQSMLAKREQGYASVNLLKLDLGTDFGAGARQRISIQKRRRAGIAECRNRLISAGLETDSGYILFVDADMGEIPQTALKDLICCNAPIVVANCLHALGSGPFDLNSFRYTRHLSDFCAGRFVKDGLYQPPPRFFRHYPNTGNPGDLEPLSSVGGTCLLVRRDVLKTGVIFPTAPYRLHIETEGFAIMAAEHGFGSFMATGVITRHSAR